MTIYYKNENLEHSKVVLVSLVFNDFEDKNVYISHMTMKHSIHFI